MPEDYYAPPPPRKGSSLKLVLAAVLLAFVGGAGLIGYLAWTGQIELERTVSAPQPAASLPAPAQSPGAAPAPATSTLETKLADLERRMAQLDLQAAAFGGTSARAEGLLVAMATRRAIEQGKPLGYLEAQLKTRFEAARPDAVKTLLAAAANPVTLDQLAAQLEDLGPALLGAPASEDGWERFKREMSGLFVIRRDSGQARKPAQRLDQARLLLRGGRIDEAIAEVSRMPGSAAAKDWIAAAQRYAAAQAALGQVEEAALNEPERLRSATGDPVQQPGLSASPPPEPKP
ncbi:MAG: hypothetical protein U1E37_09140 [Sphingomonadaceae bacterium]